MLVNAAGVVKILRCRRVDENIQPHLGDVLQRQPAAIVVENKHLPLMAQLQIQGRFNHIQQGHVEFAAPGNDVTGRRNLANLQVVIGGNQFDDI